MTPPIRRCFRGVAFTLVELLVVIGIITVLAALVGPAATSVLKGNKLTRASQLISDQLGLARQAALSENRTVEVRFYRYADPEVPGEVANNPSTGKYRALQLFKLSEAGMAVALTKLQSIPVGVIIDSGTTLSSIFNLPESTGATAISKAAANGYKYVSVRFRPDASTDLSPKSDNWFLTLHNETDGDKLSAPKSNFFTIQIDSSNGHIQGYRP